MNKHLLKELITIRNGQDHQHLANGIYPVYGSGGSMRYVNTYLYDKESVLLPRKGTLDNIQYSNTPFWTVDTLYYTERNKSFVNMHYLYYYLKLLDLKPLSTGTGVPSMTSDAYYNISVKLPEIGIQNTISDLLAAIDSKIEANRKMNSVLKNMAKTIFGYWFVQFDFPDKKNKPYRSSGGSMVYNSKLKRSIPIEWSVAALTDIATFTNGIACQKYYPAKNETGAYKVIKIREFSSGLDESSDVVTADIPANLIINDGDVLFSWSATLDVKLWSGGVGALNQHIFKVDSTDYPRSFYYFIILGYLEHFKMLADQRKTTMGHITRGHLESSYIPVPPKKLIVELDSLLNPILEQIILNSKKSQALASFRDWLLPFLMTGKIVLTQGYTSHPTPGQL